MGSYVGLDWASNGWVAAELDRAGDLSVGFYPTVWNYWHGREADPDRMLVDIPIGLPEAERRECDRRAQTALGGRASSVFLTPIRDAVYADSIERAKRLHEAADAGYSVQNQVWAIVPRIREVDVFLRETESARDRVRESHPELCFSALNAGERVEAKSDDEGIEARERLLCDELEIDPGERDRLVGRLADPSYAPRAGTDDVLDAMVLAATARRGADGERATLPADPPRDAAGLPMEIVYPTPGGTDPHNP